MTKERMLELREKYSHLFEFAEKYSNLLSFLKGMLESASKELLVTEYTNNAIGYIYCLVDLDRISRPDLFRFLCDLFDFRRDIIGL